MLYRIRISLFLLFSLASVMTIYWWGYKSPLIGIDDANIYFVYMRHFAEGQGFVWNAGGEKVEGFTSLVWTLYGALAYAITPEHFNIILLVTNFLLIFFSLRSVLLFSRKLNHPNEKSVTATDIVIVSLLLLPLGFVEWGIMALMETGLWTFLIIHITLQLCSYCLEPKAFKTLRFSAMIILLDLTRPESIALSLIFIGLLFAIFSMEKGSGPALKTIALPLMVHIITLSVVTLWRLSYFGYPFPNTYYAKVSGSIIENLQSGIRYLVLFFHSYPHAAIITAMLLLVLIQLIIPFLRREKKFSKKEGAVLVLLLIIFAGLTLPVFTGGDHFKYSRFYQPYVPLMCMIASSTFLLTEFLGVSFTPTRMKIGMIVVPLIFGLLFISKFTIFDFLKARNSVNYNILGDFTLANNARNLGKCLNETFEPFRYPSLGALATGSIAFSYEGKTIDLLGLNNTTMAHASRIKRGYRNHASFDEDGFWHLSPDMLGTFMGADIVRDTTRFVLPENTSKYRASDITYLCFKGIFDDSTFRSSYVPALVKHAGRDYFVFSYYRKSFLSELAGSADYFIKVFKRKPVPSSVLVLSRASDG